MEKIAMVKKEVQLQNWSDKEIARQESNGCSIGKDRCDNRCIEMLTEMLSGATVYIVTGYTDMRKGIDGLAQIVEGSVGKDAYSKAVYLFCGRNNTKMKALVWDGDGFLLLYKRLDNGRYRWPRTECEAKQLTSQQLRWLMEGLDIEQKSAIKPGKRKCGSKLWIIKEKNIQ